MADPRLDRLESLLLGLLAVDGSKAPSGQLRPRRLQAAADAGVPSTDAAFDVVRAGLVADGEVTKGPGRGGSTGRAATAAPSADDFSLQSAEPPASDAADAADAAPRQAGKADATRKTVRNTRVDEPAQAISDRHADRRKNNPQAGLVSKASNPHPHHGPAHRHQPAAVRAGDRPWPAPGGL